jgi:hypothetical protein
MTPRETLRTVDPASRAKPTPPLSADAARQYLNRCCKAGGHGEEDAGENDRRDEAQHATADCCKFGDDDSHDLAERRLEFHDCCREIAGDLVPAGVKALADHWPTTNSLRRRGQGEIVGLQLRHESQDCIGEIDRDKRQWRDYEHKARYDNNGGRKLGPIS